MPAVAPAELVDRARRGDRGAVAKLISLVESGGDDARGVVVGVARAHGRGVVDRHDRRAGRGEVDAHRPARRPDPQRGRDRRRARGRPEQPVQRRRDPRRSRAHAEPRDRHRCLHPVDGDAVAISGGLAVATPQAARVLDAIGTPWIVIETVGVGQVEVEIAGHADTTVVVVNPGWGDAVQAAKAGLLEIADVFVVNKADRPGAADTVRDLEGMLELAGTTEWRPPIVCTTATTGAGIDDLWDAILRASRAPPRRTAKTRRDDESGYGPRSARSSPNSCSPTRTRAVAGRRSSRSSTPWSPANAIRTTRPTRCSMIATESRIRASAGAVLDAAARGRFPAADGRFDVLPRSPGPADALIGFTGHFVLAADIPADEVAARVPPERLLGPDVADVPHLDRRSASAAGRPRSTRCCARSGRATGAPAWLEPDPTLRASACGTGAPVPRRDRRVAHRDGDGDPRGRARHLRPMGARLRDRAGSARPRSRAALIAAAAAGSCPRVHRCGRRSRRGMPRRCARSSPPVSHRSRRGPVPARWVVSGPTKRAERCPTNPKNMC